MDGIVNIKVSGNYISKDSKIAGVRGQGNTAKLAISFDEGWDEYAKTVTFYDARGANPVERTLTLDLLENMADDIRAYVLPIPFEPMAEAGYMTFIIDGYVDGEGDVKHKRMRSVSDTLEVKDSPDSRVTVDITPTQAEQLQTQVEKIKSDIQDVAVAKQEATASAESAKKNAEKAAESVGKVSYIGENGNWYAWDGVNGEFYDTGIKAQAGSTVYCGDNPPEEADVWIQPTDDAEDDKADDILKTHILLKDHETNAIYTLYVSNGELRIKEGEV